MRINLHVLPINIGASIAIISVLFSATPSYAVTARGVVSQPVSSAEDVIDDTVTPVVTPTSTTPATTTPATTVTVPTSPITSTPTTTVTVPTTSTTPTASSTTTPTTSQTSATPAQSTNTQSSTTNSTRSVQAAAPASTQAAVSAGNQAVTDGSTIDYMTGRLSPATASLFYKIAALTAAIGMVLYAATMLPSRTKPGVKPPRKDTFTRGTLRFKTGH